MELVEEPDDAFVREVADACEWATFFHSPVWHELVRRAEPGFESSPVGFVTDDGTRGYVPLIEKPADDGDGLVRRYSSTYQGCYGGVVAEREVGLEPRRAILDAIDGMNVDRIRWTGNPLADVACAQPPESMELEDDFTQLLDLTQDWDDILSGFSRGHRSSMNKAEREGVEVRSSRQLEDFERYFKAYQASLDRWGKEPEEGYPWEFFESVHEAAGDHPENIRLWLAEIDGELASGALVFYWNRHLDYWHGAAYKKYFDQRPNNLLHPEIMKHASEIEDDDGSQKYEVYDFNPSGGIEGVVNFKSRFGPEKVEFQRGAVDNQIAEVAGNFVSMIRGE